MAPGPGVYSDRSYDTPEQPQENQPRKRRVPRGSAPDQPVVIDGEEIPQPHPSQPARDPRVGRRAENPEQEVSNLESETEPNVGGRRQSRNPPPLAQEPRGTKREYSDSEELREYRERDPNPWRTNDNQEPHGQTAFRLNPDTRTLADHILRQYPPWMKQSDVEKQYTALDTMIELFRNDQRARQPTLNVRSRTASMTRQQYEGLLGTWRNGKGFYESFDVANPPPNMSSLIEANVARGLNEAELQRQARLETDFPRPRERAQIIVYPEIPRQTSLPNLVRSARDPVRSTTPLTPPPAVPANHRSQRPDLGNFVTTGAYPPIPRSVGSGNRSEIARAAVAYQFPRGNDPAPVHRAQPQRFVSGNNETLINDPAGPRVANPFNCDPLWTPAHSRAPSSRRHATVQDAAEHLAFPAPRRLQRVGGDLRGERNQPSPVVDRDEGELPDSQ
ncbi:uncharacterized protein H6S33_010977 [Morchella sextelata]|uniref:uncharacterized protein n=1 Tax=Morchella sextelata TaxID=1174677 RepID=UPI001D0412BD|nr:uncharacterized protein H6S33_010977 [Morchella sextelata]KAH0611712.1 hypothetical protein H6S33_010977 [Morchella sextelata]